MSKNKALDEFVKRLNAMDTRLTVQQLKTNVLTNRIALLEDDESDDETEEVKVEVEEKKTDLTIGQAIDLLKSGDAEKISCYIYAHTYMYMCDEKQELRTKALNGIDYPWVIKEREMEATFRVVE